MAIYVKRKKAHNFKNVFEVFPLTFDRVVERIERYNSNGDIDYTVGSICHPSKTNPEQNPEFKFKGQRYFIQEIAVDVGEIEGIGIIVAHSQNEDALTNLKKILGLEGTFLS